MLNGILKLFGLFSNNIGVDLGTANTVIYLEGKGVVLSEPSIVAVDVKTGKVIAVGREAKEMLGKTPETIQTIRPLRDGVITDFEATRIMLSYFINKVVGGGILKPKPRVVVGVPSGVTQVEKRAVIDAAKSAGRKGGILNSGTHGSGHRCRSSHRRALLEIWWWILEGAPQR
jgi:rod shape-determining protein MreB